MKRKLIGYGIQGDLRLINSAVCRRFLRWMINISELPCHVTHLVSQCGKCFHHGCTDEFNQTLTSPKKLNIIEHFPTHPHICRQKKRKKNRTGSDLWSDRLTHNMAVHLLCSYAATFSGVITRICPPAKSWLPHSFTPCLATHRFAPRMVNILIERRSVQCCDETIEEQGEMRTLETASCPPPPRCTRLTALAHPVSSGSHWPVVTHKGLDLALIILEETVNTALLKVKSARTKIQETWSRMYGRSYCGFNSCHNCANDDLVL